MVVVVNTNINVNVIMDVFTIIQKIEENYEDTDFRII